MEPLYFPPDSLLVCIDEKQDNRIIGRVFGTMLEEEFFFSDTSDFLLKIDEAFDKQGYPQAFQVKRTFHEETRPQYPTYNFKPEVKSPPEKFLHHRGDLITYIVRVISRQNASWQGKVTTPEGKLVGSFNSELELIKLL